jgi:hypothetical protein
MQAEDTRRTTHRDGIRLGLRFLRELQPKSRIVPAAVLFVVAIVTAIVDHRDCMPESLKQSLVGALVLIAAPLCAAGLALLLVLPARPSGRGWWARMLIGVGLLLPSYFVPERWLPPRENQKNCTPFPDSDGLRCTSPRTETHGHRAEEGNE